MQESDFEIGKIYVWKDRVTLDYIFFQVKEIEETIEGTLLTIRPLLSSYNAEIPTEVVINKFLLRDTRESSASEVSIELLKEL